MKTYLIQTIAILGLLSLFSCEDEKYDLYDSSATNKIYFSTDTVEFSFGFKMDTQEDIVIPLNIMGLANLQNDIAFKFVATAESSAVEGTHYAFPTESVLKKDSVYAYLSIDILKDALEKDVEYTLDLELVENENFIPVDKTLCHIVFGDISMEIPVWWSASTLGIYNQDKLVMMVELFTKAKELSPIYYNNLEVRYGEHLNEIYLWGGWFDYTYNMLNDSKSFWKKYVYEPMYKHYLETGDARYEIPNPNI